MLKTPRSYPKIPDTKDCPLTQCWAFVKYDGTNFHALWDQDHWSSFGTRRYSWDFNQEGKKELAIKYDGLHEAPAIVERVYAPFGHLYRGRKLLLFFEFLGPHSFAGLHQASDPKRLILIDAQVDDRWLPPQEFLDAFGGKPHPEYYLAEVVYKGKYSGQLADDVRKGKYPIEEGVVIKGVVDGEVYRAKVKTDAYLKRLKDFFKDDWERYWE